MTAFEMRPYQNDLIRSVHTDMAAGLRPMVQLETGGGKTAVGAEIVRRMLDKHPTAVVGWVAHRNELLDQAADVLERVGVESGSWAKLPADRRCWADWAGKVLLLSSSARSWPAEKLTAGRMSLCVVDEAHHSTSSTYRKLLALGWRYRLGLTGTPWRMSDYEGFEDVWDTLICGPDYSELRSLGYLADFRVVEPTVKLPENLPTDDMGEIDSRAAGAAVIELLRTDVVVNEWRAAVAPLVDRRTIWYLPTVTAASRLAEVLYEADEHAAVLTAKTPRADRRRMVDDFKHGRLMHLLNVAVATEGFDVPDCAVVVHLRPTKSLSLYRQINGRALRASEGKPYAVIVDMARNTMMHGDPATKMHWSLAARKIRNDEVSRMPTVECPRCGHSQHPALRCCGRCGQRLWWGCGADTAGERGCGRDRFWHHYTDTISTLHADMVRHCRDCRHVAHLIETVGSGQLCLPGI